MLFANTTLMIACSSHERVKIDPYCIITTLLEIVALKLSLHCAMKLVPREVMVVAGSDLCDRN